jgi:hypothetical protein
LLFCRRLQRFRPFPESGLVNQPFITGQDDFNGVFEDSQFVLTGTGQFPRRSWGRAPGLEKTLRFFHEWVAR